MTLSPPVLAAAREEFDRLVKQFRPNLHRYCARMTGSVVDAEDVVQETLAKAYYLLPTTEVSNLEGWLYRIAHNKAIDYLRKTGSGQTEALDEHPLHADLAQPLENEEFATLALSIYLQLTPLQRSCVILKDVIGYSLSEISELLDASVGAVKAALHRGRQNLRKLSESVDSGVPLRLEEPEASLLARYVERFNARDFDAVRAMLADDVRLDLVERLKVRGSVDVGQYFDNYDRQDDWYLSLGFVERKPAVLISGPGKPSPVLYFVFIEWDRGEISWIQDYRYARHVMVDAEITRHEDSGTERA